MTKSVLCAVDVSNPLNDVNVMQTAAQMANLHGVQLDVITVVPNYGMSQVSNYFSDDHHEKLVDESKKILNDMTENALGKDVNAKVRHIVAIGKVYDEVLKVAKKIDPSLIVVGSNKEELSDFLLGPNAARIVRHAQCSVYVVR